TATAKSTKDVWIGRAVARVQPNRGRMLDEYGAFDDEDELDHEPEFHESRTHPGAAWAELRRIRGPLIVGTVLVIAIVVATTWLVRAGAKSACPARGCVAAPTQSAAKVPAGPRATPSTPVPSQPTGTVAAVAATPPLAAVMPADVNLRSCKTTDDDPF